MQESTSLSCYLTWVVIAQCLSYQLFKRPVLMNRTLHASGRRFSTAVCVSLQSLPCLLYLESQLGLLPMLVFASQGAACNAAAAAAVAVVMPVGHCNSCIWSFAYAVCDSWEACNYWAGQFGHSGYDGSRQLFIDQDYSGAAMADRPQSLVEPCLILLTS